MKQIFYVGEITSGIANYKGIDEPVIFVTRIDEIHTVDGAKEFTTLRAQLVTDNKEFAVYPDPHAIVAIVPSALHGIFNHR